MFKSLNIIWQGFAVTLQELKKNRLRTFLSLFGITIGIFCIIGILSIIDSLKTNIEKKLSSFTNRVIWIDRFNYSDGGDDDFSWMKYLKRHPMTYDQMLYVKRNTTTAANVSFFVDMLSNIGYKDFVIENKVFNIVEEEYDKFENFNIIEGRFISNDEFERGVACCVLGYNIAETFFGDVQKAVGKTVDMKGKKMIVAGVIEKQGSSGRGLDDDVIIPYRFFISYFNPEAYNFRIMVKAKQNVPFNSFLDELKGNMRKIRKLSPKMNDDFSLNNIDELVGKEISEGVNQLKIAAWAIAGLSLIVGAFGIANIMFVTVKERTSIIGLKKAIGAKQKYILTEFLIESSFLSIFGGLMGLLFVWLLFQILNLSFSFPLFISLPIILLAFGICIVIGILAGIIPAMQAAKMDPVVAIRTK